MEQHNGQVLFFQQIKSLLPPHLSVADEIAKVLDISTDSAYRRIRGEKPINFEDIQKLSAVYKVSVDQFLQIQTNGFIFTGNLGYSSTGFVERYLNDMLQSLNLCVVLIISIFIFFRMIFLLLHISSFQSWPHSPSFSIKKACFILMK